METLDSSQLVSTKGTVMMMYVLFWHASLSGFLGITYLIDNAEQIFGDVYLNSLWLKFAPLTRIK